MDSGAQSSFIPHDAAAPISSPRIKAPSGLSDLLLLFSIVMFVASIALAGAVLLYMQYLSTSAASKLQQLQRAKESFEPALIQELTRLDDRMHVAEQVLGSHIAPTAFFNALEETTLSTIAFDTLDFQAIDRQRMNIKMSGLGQSVNSIALQADLLSKNGSITSPIFSNINRQTDGVKFDLTALLNPVSVNYVHILSGLNQPAAAAEAVDTQENTNPVFGPQRAGQAASSTTPSPAPAR